VLTFSNLDTPNEKDLQVLESGDYTVLTLDFCDILFFRPGKDPADFLEITFQEQVDHRLSIESALRESAIKEGRQEITAEEIYKIAVADMSVELDALREWARPYRGISKFLEEARKYVQKIFIVSDFYFGENTIQNLLERYQLGEAFDGIFVSADNKLTKHHGSLFYAVQEKVQVPFSQWLHVGSDLRSDYEIPTKLGLNAINIPRNVGTPGFYSAITSPIHPDLTPSLHDFAHMKLAPAAYAFLSWLRQCADSPLMFIGPELWLPYLMNLADGDSRYLQDHPLELSESVPATGITSTAPATEYQVVSIGWKFDDSDRATLHFGLFKGVSHKKCRAFLNEVYPKAVPVLPKISEILEKLFSSTSGDISSSPGRLAGSIKASYEAKILGAMHQTAQQYIENEHPKVLERLELSSVVKELVEELLTPHEAVATQLGLLVKESTENDPKNRFFYASTYDGKENLWKIDYSTKYSKREVLLRKIRWLAIKLLRPTWLILPLSIRKNLSPMAKRFVPR